MKTLLAAAALTMLSTAAFAQASPQDFAKMAASGGLYEIQSSEMILKDGSASAEVKAFAEQMVADHTKAGADLKAAAQKAGVDVPAAPASKEATKLKQLGEAPAAEREKLYLTQQRLAHNDAVVLHRAYAASGTDPNLKAYAEKVVPIMEEHSTHVDKLQADMAK
ncbi:DUF4142 domain-containing protein [Aureimonas sp. ME7]|uniref:DUF4142 domain-containing protein n=1 Tax=Aureimonas sp. ME7 TaxID=2744252 RepID=UPI0015F65848|nr:DUF4142 domain-containing protein [Aureimonas sp. ME7]